MRSYPIAIKLPFEFTILEIFDSPHTEALLGKSLLDKTTIKLINNLAPLSHVSLVALHLLSNDKIMHLIDIVKLFKDLGFNYVNIYEISCRSIAKDVTKEQLNDINKSESDITYRTSKKLGGKTKIKIKQK